MNISQPPPFLHLPGDPAVPWNQWLSGFRMYLVALDGDGYAAARKRALLLHCLGTEGQRLFNTLPARIDPPGTATDYDNTIFCLERHFQPKVNVVAERYKFRQRAQLPGESIANYVAALRELGKTCEFGATEDEMIRDQIVEKINSSKIRERLLMEEALTLEKCVNVTGRMLNAARDAKAIGTRPTDVNSVSGQSISAHKSASGQNTRPRQCFRCGSSNHLANDSRCKARDKICSKCSKRGHFAVVCRSSGPAQPAPKEVHFIDRDRSEASSVSSDSVSDDDVYVLATHEMTQSARPREAIRCSVLVNDAPIRLLVDTGSSVSLMSRATFDQFFMPEALEACPRGFRLESYTQHPIELMGLFNMTIRHLDKVAVGKLYVVENGLNILGRDLVQSLGLNIDGATLTCNSVSSTGDTEALPEYVQKYTKLFETNEKLRSVKGFVHKVKVNSNVRPKQQKLRRLPFSVRDTVSAELTKLEKMGVIEKINAAEWVSPIVVAYKKTGKVRICVDLREVNKAVIPDRFPLPKIDELLCELRNAKVFSQLDLASAYHQLELAEESRDLTAFITHDGLYRYKRVCFGLSSAPSAFQKMMSQLLAGFKGVQVYLDDVIIYGKTEVEHNANVQAVLGKLQSHGIRLNTKCQFNQSGLDFLGHKISPEGIQVDDKYKDIVNASVPADKKTLQSFLGLAGYFSKFINKYAEVVEPLRELLRTSAGVEFSWSSSAQEAFDNVRQAICEKRTLAMFDPDLDVVVSTDASHCGLGACLSQVKNGREVLVSCISRSLSEAERKYSVGEKEALACVWACEKWHVYLWGRRFKLYTDHKALVTLLQKGTDRQSMRIARWSARLLRYDYEMVYRKGSENIIADAMSRLSVKNKDDSSFDDDSDVVCHVHSVFKSMAADCITLDDLVKASKGTEFMLLQRYVERGWPKIGKIEPAAIPFFQVRDELCFVDGILLRGDRIVVPPVLRSRLLNLAHESHQGMTRTKQRLRELYWWPGMDTEVECLVKHCVVCGYNDKSVKGRVAPLMPVEYPKCAWDKVGIDIVGPFEKGPNQCRYAITMIDYFSKWPEVCFTPTVTTAKVLEFLKRVFSREGFPVEIVTDNGVQFKSNEFENFCAERGIRHICSSLYYPQSNGAIERFNSVLKNTVQNAIYERKSWAEATIQFLAIYRATAHATTGCAPSVLLHGRPMRTKLNISGRSMPKPKVQERELRDTVGSAQARYKANFDKRKCPRLVTFNIGDWVMVRKPGNLPKGERRYSDPIQITKSIGNRTYETSDRRRWNVSKLVKCNVPVEPSEVFDFDVPNEPGTPIVVDVPAPVNVPAPPPVNRRSTRTRRPPKYLDDYVT